MKLKHADARNWVIKLRDGFLQMQRVFSFDDASLAAEFISQIGGLECPAEVRFWVRNRPVAEHSIVVVIEFLPEGEMSQLGGEIAAACEHHYKSVQAFVHAAA